MRLLFGLPFAAVVTAALFVVMYGLVAPGEVRLAPQTERQDISIFMAPEPEAWNPFDGRIDNQVEAPPPIKTSPAKADIGGGGFAAADIGPLGPTKIEPQFGPPTLMPIAMISPQFPGSCQSRGTEGYAVVRYDVSGTGQVVNATIVDRSHRCFEQAALQAIRSWRYQPAPGHQGYIARGVTKRFAFTLEEV